MHDNHLVQHEWLFFMLLSSHDFKSVEDCYLIRNNWGGLTSEFWGNRPLIGMVHLKALPGSVLDLGYGLDDTVNFALEDVRALESGGAAAVMIENFFDIPFASGTVARHTIIAMSLAVAEIRKVTLLPIGVNVLRNDAIGALSIAHICKAQFVRVNVFVGAAVTDQGIIQGAAREIVTLRKELNADVAIWADVFVKHATQLGGGKIEDAARDAVHRGLADALIVSGSATGSDTSLADLEAVRNALPDTHILVGSGFNISTAADLLQFANGAIVGTSIKKGGAVENCVDVERVRVLRLAMNAIK